MRTHRFLNAALWLAGRGMHVFPLRPGTKLPAVRADWEGCATTDVDQIHRWWDAGRSNIGVATGRCGLLVIDLDVPRESGAMSGTDMLRAVAAAAGATVPARTMTVATPSGGRHLYFRAPAGVHLTNTAGRLGTLVDTRGIGGYVVGPGSVIGRTPYRLLRIDEPAALPGWLLDALRPRPLPPLPISGDGPRRHRAYVDAAVAGEAARVAGAPVGRRNAVLFSAAARLARFVAVGELRADDVDAALRAAADRHVGTHGFTAVEIARTIRSGLRARSGSSCPQSAGSAGGRHSGRAPSGA